MHQDILESAARSIHRADQDMTAQGLIPSTNDGVCQRWDLLPEQLRSVYFNRAAAAFRAAAHRDQNHLDPELIKVDGKRYVLVEVKQ